MTLWARSGFIGVQWHMGESWYQVDWRGPNAWIPFSIRHGKRPMWKHVPLGPLGMITYGKIGGTVDA